ncbi:MAG: hypothetical protein ACRDXX_12555 [Stackebrandtia sp.]
MSENHRRRETAADETVSPFPSLIESRKARTPPPPPHVEGEQDEPDKQAENFPGTDLVARPVYEPAAEKTSLVQRFLPRRKKRAEAAQAAAAADPLAFPEEPQRLVPVKRRIRVVARPAESDESQPATPPNQAEQLAIEQRQTVQPRTVELGAGYFQIEDAETVELGTDVTQPLPVVQERPAPPAPEQIAESAAPAVPKPVGETETPAATHESQTSVAAETIVEPAAQAEPEPATVVDTPSDAEPSAGAEPPAAETDAATVASPHRRDEREALEAVAAANKVDRWAVDAASLERVGRFLRERMWRSSKPAKSEPTPSAAAAAQAQPQAEGAEPATPEPAAEGQFVPESAVAPDAESPADPASAPADKTSSAEPAAEAADTPFQGDGDPDAAQEPAAEEQAPLAAAEPDAESPADPASSDGESDVAPDPAIQGQPAPESAAEPDAASPEEPTAKGQTSSTAAAEPASVAAGKNPYADAGPWPRAADAPSQGENAAKTTVPAEQLPPAAPGAWPPVNAAHTDAPPPAAPSGPTLAGEPSPLFDLLTPPAHSAPEPEQPPAAEEESFLSAVFESQAEAAAPAPQQPPAPPGDPSPAAESESVLADEQTFLDSVFDNGDAAKRRTKSSESEDEMRPVHESAPEAGAEPQPPPAPAQPSSPPPPWPIPGDRSTTSAALEAALPTPPRIIDAVVIHESQAQKSFRGPSTPSAVATQQRSEPVHLRPVETPTSDLVPAERKQPTGRAPWEQNEPSRAFVPTPAADIAYASRRFARAATSTPRRRVWLVAAVAAAFAAILVLVVVLWGTSGANSGHMTPRYDPIADSYTGAPADLEADPLPEAADVEGIDSGVFLLKSSDGESCAGPHPVEGDAGSRLEWAAVDCGDAAAAISVTEVGSGRAIFRFDSEVAAEPYGECLAPTELRKHVGFRDAPCEGEIRGHFYLDGVSDGVFRVRSAASEYCMSFGGERIVQATCRADTPAQEFTFEPVEDSSAPRR